MKVLIVGGTGMIGGHLALFLKSQGHDVTIAARNAPLATTELPSLPFLQGDYSRGDFAEQDFAQFDALIFAAGNDIRHLPGDIGAAEHYQRTNVEGIPRLFEQARAAGIATAIYIGSFYPQAVPELIGDDPYLRSRKLADEAVRSLDAPGFRVSSLSAPVIVGSVPGLPVPFFDALFSYALGEFAPISVFAPPGESNFMSTLSLSEAIYGALLRGEPGKAYLIGDENLSYRDFFQLFFDAAGTMEKLHPLDKEHPMLPDAAQPAGRGAVIRYMPDSVETELLRYRRNDVGRAVQELWADYCMRLRRD